MAAVAAAMAFITITAGGTGALGPPVINAGFAPVDDPAADLVFCDTTEAVPSELVALDLVSVEPVEVRAEGEDRWAVQFVARGAQNLGREVSEIRDRDPLVGIRLGREPGDTDWIELRAGWSGDALIRSVVDASGHDVPGTSLAVDEGPDGEAVFAASGLPFGPGTAWGAFTRFQVEARLACDKLLDSLSPTGEPLLPLVETGGGEQPDVRRPALENPTPAERSPAPDAGGPGRWWAAAAAPAVVGAGAWSWWYRNRRRRNLDDARADALPAGASEPDSDPRLPGLPSQTEIEGMRLLLEILSGAVQPDCEELDALWRDLTRQAEDERHAAAALSRQVEEAAARLERARQEAQAAAAARAQGDDSFEAFQREQAARGALEEAESGLEAVTSTRNADEERARSLEAQAESARRQADDCWQESGRTRPEDDEPLSSDDWGA